MNKPTRKTAHKVLTEAEKSWIRIQHDLSEEICKAKEIAGLSDASIIKKAAITKKHWAQIMSGVFDITIAQLQRIATVMGARVDMFLVDPRTDEWNVKRAVMNVELEAMIKGPGSV